MPDTRIRLSAVITTHRPDEGLLLSIRRLQPQVDSIVVVDDGSGASADPLLERAAAEPGVALVRLDTNSGIAAALNAGVRAALDEAADFVLTLDQDSLVAGDYATVAVRALGRLHRAGRGPAILAAGTQSGMRVRAVRYEDRGDRLTPTLEAIQSGMVIPVEVFLRIGWFDETLFIDCVDTDFVVRAAASGIPTYLMRDCAIAHPLGREIAIRGPRVSRSGRRSLAFHPAWRRYYISRNRAIVFARHSFFRPDWVAVGLAGEALQLARCLVFGPDKGRQAAAVIFGVVDAARLRRGRLTGVARAVLGGPASTHARPQ